MTDLTSSTVAQIPQECKSCFAKTNPEDSFCQACGFPLKGSQEEQEAFLSKRQYQHGEIHLLNQKIKSAGTSLYVLAAVFLVYGLIYFFKDSSSNESSAILITNAIVAVIFLLLGVWSSKKPVAAIISGMVLYATVLIIGAIDDPISLFKGIIFKIFIIAYLIKGLMAALEADKIRKLHNI